ncbi:hypothetical protein PV327_002776, partial [Microctonus hyperodae]
MRSALSEVVDPVKETKTDGYKFYLIQCSENILQHRIDTTFTCIHIQAFGHFVKMMMTMTITRQQECYTY